MFKKILIAFLILFHSYQGYSQTMILNEFEGVADSLTVLLKERTGITSELSFERITKKGTSLDFYFTRTLGDYPWRDEDIEWMRGRLLDLFPEKYSNWQLGGIYVHRTLINNIITPSLDNSGKASEYKYSYKDPSKDSFVEQIGVPAIKKGMSGRTIALWQSHGRYFNNDEHVWKWQRAPLHTTSEDLLTQSFVIPFLIPMLENAGAYIMSPRERDTQVRESIIDNDTAFTEEREGLTRTSGVYAEEGKWENGGIGFADKKLHYELGDNPFTLGSFRKANMTSGKTATARIRWTPEIDCRGKYAVYVSYGSIENSSSCAHYSVHHMGGESEFIVNQKIGGGTWIYLGNFEMDGNSYVELDNAVPSGRKFEKGCVVTADAVKIGGGIGKIEREGQTSGMPAYLEGALYWEQWAGSGSKITEEWDDDYTKDFAGRGAWTTMMLKDKKIPFDMSFALHSDAGTASNDSIVGTLSIYTLLCDNSDRLPDGKSRYTCRSLADLVQSQVVEDIRKKYEPSWERRELWDRSYSEARTTSVPGMILELLSHQNFADMKYALDPSFRFTVSRSIYKGMLKFLSNLYDVDYVVQPLPVNSFAVSIIEGGVRLSWKATDDPLEPTAAPTKFILQKRIGDGAFDNGTLIQPENLKRKDDLFYYDVPIKAGRIYSFRIIAFNDGGKSFPSETLCAGLPGSFKEWKDRDNTVMVVNNFDRLSAPAWFDTPTYAGFDRKTDSGVGYINDISFIGENYQLRRDLLWVDDDNAGFGASYTDKAGTIIPGNTFDFAYIHGKAAFDNGYAFYSVSRDAWTNDCSLGDNAFTTDIICGKQVTTMVGRGAVDSKYSVFPAGLRNAISSYTENCGNIIISGAYIGTDVWDKVFPVENDGSEVQASKKFIENVLGWKWKCAYASPSGKLYKETDSMLGKILSSEELRFHSELNPYIYCAENVNGIVPAGSKSETVLRYSGNDVSAAVFFNSGTYKVLSVGFPLETLEEKEYIYEILGAALNTFK